MKATLKLKDGISWSEAFGILAEILEKSAKIEVDPHTNKHFELRKGIIWKKGDGTGKYWDYLCNSRQAIKKAHEMMGY